MAGRAGGAEAEPATTRFEREVRRVEALRGGIDPVLRDWRGVPLVAAQDGDGPTRVVFAHTVSQVMVHFEGPAGAPGQGALAAAASDAERRRLLAAYRAAMQKVKIMSERRRQAWRLAGMPFGPDPEDERRYWRAWLDHVRGSARHVLSAL